MSCNSHGCLHHTVLRLNLAVYMIYYVSNNTGAKVGIVAEYNSHESYNTDVAT